ncbi:zonular occludens toxin domain-containing protein [Acinetobacter venetianus]|uniref:zonular occludens toxin domain-containing protein n=1 Tax=Acinetobacter venetianus TaxID=52133 RepID=UPI00384CEE2D
MIHFLSATPGSGKSLLATDLLLELSRENIANLKYNYYYAKAFFEKLKFLKLESYLDLVLVTKGQGLERTSEIHFLEPDFFDFLKIEYFINVISNPQTDDIVNNFPPYYFERIALLNTIIDNLNVNENTKFQHFKAVRTIYTNIADLKLVQCRPLPPDCDWRQTPQGSYLVIDEAQLIPIFSEEARGIDPIVKDLTIHRHKGYDFLFITQEPSFVHKYIRKLASLHIHLVNIFGWEQSMRMEWSIVQDSPNAIKSIARAENISRWRFPKHVYNLYKSTTINTRKKRIPKKLVLFIAIAILFFISAAFLFLKSQNSPLVSMVTGKPIAEQPEQTQGKKNDSTTKPIAEQPSNTKQTDSKTVQDKNATDSNTAASEPVTYAESTYSASDPFAYEPVYVPQPVNHRVFSGCLCVKNTCSAYDQQGTKITGINPKVCKDLINDSSSRPFDYFNNRSQQTATERVSTSEQT